MNKVYGGIMYEPEIRVNKVNGALYMRCEATLRLTKTSRLQEPYVFLSE